MGLLRDAHPHGNRQSARIIASVCFGLVCLGGVLAPGQAAAAPPPSFAATACEHYSDAVFRLYQAAFGRVPDEGGFNYWLDLYQTGEFQLRAQAGFFLESDEFRNLYGSDLSDSEFVDTLYRNLLGRAGEPEGTSYWIEKLNDGLARDMLLLAFSESPENVAKTETAPPALGSFNDGLHQPWSCEQPTCSVDTSETVEQVVLTFVSVLSTQNAFALVDFTYQDGSTTAAEVELGPALVGERIRYQMNRPGLVACNVLATAYDSRPFHELPGSCSIASIAADGRYTVTVSFVPDHSGEAVLDIATRDNAGNRIYTGYHLYNVQSGVRIERTSGYYPMSTAQPTSCQIMRYRYN